MHTAYETHRRGLAPMPLAPGADPGSTRSPARAMPATSGPASPGATSSGTRHRWRKFGVIGAVLIGGAAAVFLLFPTSRASFIADSIDVPDSIVAGEDVDVDVHVRNTGDSGGEHEFRLLVDGESAATSTVELEAESGTTIELTVTDLEAGLHELSIEGFDDVRHSLLVLTPADFVIDELRVSPQQVDLSVDPVVTVHVRYSNIGETAGTRSLQVTLDGRLVEQRDVTLDSGESGEATFTLTMDTPGHPVIGVDDATAEIWVLTPAELAIGSVTVTPNPANLTGGNILTVTTTVSNIGEIDGTFTLELAHNGSVIETREVAVAARQSIEQQFTVTIAFPGMQVVSVNDIQAEVEVYWLARPADGTVVINELGGGPNRLTIENQRDEDVYVVLTAAGEGQQPLLGVYVHAGSTQTVRGVRSGSYATFFVHGSAWCTHYQRFTADADYGRFDDDSWFESSPSSYTVITLTFGASDGWSPTSSVDPANFPH